MSAEICFTIWNYIPEDQNEDSNEVKQKMKQHVVVCLVDMYFTMNVYQNGSNKIHTLVQIVEKR